MGRNNTQGERLTTVELVTAQNAEAINKLTEVVDKLSDLVAKEDKRLSKTLEELKRSQDMCKARHDSFMQSLEDKKEVIRELKKIVVIKADKDEVKAIRGVLLKIMWGVFAFVGATVGSAIVWVIQHSK